MQLQKNDLDVLRHLIRFGFSTSVCLVEFGYWSHMKSAWRRLKQLDDQGLIERWDWRMDRANLIRVTREGYNLLDYEAETRSDQDTIALSFPKSWPTIREVDHDLGVQFLIAKTVLNHESVDGFLTERELYSKKYPLYFSRAGHRQIDEVSDEDVIERMPDYVAYSNDDDRRLYVAVEFEHTRKKNKRVKEIIQKYDHYLECPFEKVSVWGRTAGLVKRWCDQVPESSDEHFSAGFRLENPSLVDEAPDRWLLKSKEHVELNTNTRDETFVRYREDWSHFNIHGCSDCDQGGTIDKEAVDSDALFDPRTREREVLDSLKSGTVQGE
jgi:hypothetical protein